MEDHHEGYVPTGQTGTVFVIGSAGNVGKHVVQYLVENKVGLDIICNDITYSKENALRKEVRQGKESGYGPRMHPSLNPLIEMALSDLIIHVAGAPRRSDQSRYALAQANAPIAKHWGELLKQAMELRDCIRKGTSLETAAASRCTLEGYTPEEISSISYAIALKKEPPVTTYVANPVTLNTEVFLRASGVSPKYVIGSASELDKTRILEAIADYLGISTESMNAAVWGAHGDENLVVVPEKITILGIPLTEFVRTEYKREYSAKMKEIKSIIDRAKFGAEDLVRELNGTVFGPAKEIVELAKILLYAQNTTIVNAITHYDGIFGVNGVSLSGPVKLRRGANMGLLGIDPGKAGTRALQKAHAKEISALEKVLEELGVG